MNNKTIPVKDETYQLLKIEKITRMLHEKRTITWDEFLSKLLEEVEYAGKERATVQEGL